jgi:signal transduction histidine kinase
MKPASAHNDSSTLPFSFFGELSQDAMGYLFDVESESYLNSATFSLLETTSKKSCYDILTQIIESPRLTLDPHGFFNGSRKNQFLTTILSGKTLEVSVFEITHPFSQKEGVGYHLKDSTEHIQRLSDLSESLRVRDSFLSMVSHDIRNPLSVLNSWVQFLKINPTKGEELGSILNALDRNVQRIGRLASDLIDKASIANGRMKIQKEPVQVNELLAEICESTQPLFLPKNIKVLTDWDPAVATVYLDSMRTEQAITNLLHNAIKFSPIHGTISLQTKRLKSEVLISIQDTGPGFADQEVQHVFEPFWQGKFQSQAKSVQGLGLGLSIASGIVQLHEGSISAQNRRDGHSGALFELKFPLHASCERPSSKVLSKRGSKSICL